MLYEDRLEAFGITDATLRDAAKGFRETRKDLVHEKAIAGSSMTGRIRTAQKEAKHAVDFVTRVADLLSLNHPGFVGELLV